MEASEFNLIIVKLLHKCVNNCIGVENDTLKIKTIYSKKMAKQIEIDKTTAQLTKFFKENRFSDTY